MAPTFLAFIAAAVVSLATSWLLVTRIERVGERLGLSEAILGVTAALAADAPEITSAISALAQHERAVGAGVVIGSNVFNLAALLGLSAVVSGFLALHRRVIALGGVLALWVAGWGLLVTTHALSAPVALVAVAAVLVAYVGLLGVRRDVLARRPGRAASWLLAAITEEDEEFDVALRAPRGRARDASSVSLPSWWSWSPAW